VMKNDKIDETFREKIDKISGMPSDVGWNSEKGWNDYAEQYFSKRIIGRRFLLYMSSAAAVLLLITFSVLIFQATHYRTLKISNNTDQIKEFVLPDSNKIWLNKDSFVEFPSKIDGKHNKFSVRGEAYFEFSVLQNSQYIIKARNAVIVAEKPCNLNIRVRMEEENVNITVASGAIKIMEESNQEGLKLLVTEGNYCSVHKSRDLAYTSVNRNYNYLAWKTGKLTFNSMPIATVTDILAEYYQTQIELEDKTLAYCLFTGTFEDQPIDIVLNQIQTELNFVIKNTGNKITISGKGCL
jgi:transmembrane sensor